MNQCKRAMIPFVRQQLMVPRRTLFSRRSPWALVDLPRQVEDLERVFSRMEREMNAAFRDVNRFGSPLRFQSLLEPMSSARGGFFPTIEAQTKAGENGGHKYLIKMDLGQGFNPENIKVSLKDRVMTIEAKIEQKSEDGKSRMYQEVSRSFTLPENVKIEEVKSMFTPDGELLIEAPLPEIEAPKPKEIPIAVESK